MNPSDLPERPPTLQPLWHREGRLCSFNHLPHLERCLVVIPFPWRLVTHPVIGAAYMPLWADAHPMGPAAVYEAALDRVDGFRFATDGESKPFPERTAQ